MKNAVFSLSRGRWSILLLIFLLSWGSTGVAGERSLVIDDFSGFSISVAQPDAVSVAVIEGRLAVSVDCTEGQRRYVGIPILFTAQDHKVQLTLSKAEYLPYLGKFATDTSGQPIRRSFEHSYLEYLHGPVQFSLAPGYHQELHLYLKCRKAAPGYTGVVHIDRLEIVPMEFVDGRKFAALLAEILLLLFILPGFLAYTALFRNASREGLLVWLTPLSIFSFLLLYLVLLANQWLSSPAGFWLLSAGYLGLNLILIAWIGMKRQFSLLTNNFLLIKSELLALAIVMFGIAFILTSWLQLPLHTFTYNHLRPLTYGAFGAHDPVFQFINGIAILHDEPFLKFYEKSKLFYDVQDRGILVGVLYAVARGIVNPFQADIANSYGFYTLFGSVLNVLVLLPLFALHKYFFAGRPRPLLILLLISASAFVVTNFFITWFKLAGAGLVISGLVLLLHDKNQLKPWLFAGIMWGLATSFHSGIALALPFLTIWLLCRSFSGEKWRVFLMAGAAIALLGSFVVVNLPWSLVKAAHFPDSNTLFRQHFLASQPYDEAKGIAGSIENFLVKYPVDQQLETRKERLVGSLRSKEFLTLFELPEKVPMQRVLKVWNRFEASYTVFVFAPLIILLGVSSLLGRLLPWASWSRPLIAARSDFGWLLATQVLTIFFIIIASFGSLAPDITWHIPMSCLVIVLYLLIHANLATGMIGAALLVIYALFTHYRLFFQYF